MRYKNALVLLVAGVSAAALSACSIARDYSDSEKEMISTLTPSKYQPATRKMRTNIETQELLAQAAFWSREYQLNPADLEAAVKLASAVRKMGNASKAAEITQTTRALYPDDPYLIAENAAALIALDRGQEAIKPLNKALHAAPGYARLWSLKGAAMDQIGNYDQARQHYNRAMQISPNDPNIMANMGLSFALAGDPRTAEQWLKRAASHPDAGDGIRQNYDLVLQLQGKPAHFANMQKPKAAAPRQRTQPAAPQGVQSSAAYGSYTPQQYNAPYQSPMPQPSHFGHRSPVTIVGNQSGTPKSAMDMARAAASQSSQNRVVVPHQPTVKPPMNAQGNILDRIGRSVNQKQAAAQTPPVYSAQSVPSRPQLTQPLLPGRGAPYQAPQQPQSQAPRGYPAQGFPAQGYPAQGQPAQGQPAQEQPAYNPYESAPQRRGALRRR